MNKKTLLYITLMALVIFIVPIQALASTNIIEEIGDDFIITPQSADTSISWKLKADQSNTRSVYLEEDDTITVTAVLSSSKLSSRIGIIDMDDTYNVKSIKGAGSLSYTAPETGVYRIYFKNTSGSTISTVINYTIE